VDLAASGLADVALNVRETCIVLTVAPPLAYYRSKNSSSMARPKSGESLSISPPQAYI
jgi:hypothetical protein